MNYYLCSLRLLTALFIISLSGSCNHLQSQIPLNQSVSVYGDIRAGYFGLLRDDRNGDDVEIHQFRIRTRAGFIYKANDALSFQIRYAFRLTNEDYAFKPGFGTTEEGNRGLLTEEGGFDEAFAQYLSGNYRFRAGRFVSAFSLPGLITNSILRNDSPNMDVKYTDGIWLHITGRDGWIFDAITQFHVWNYPTNEMKAPLDFSDKASKATFFSSVTKNMQGTIRMAGLNATSTQNALANGTKPYLAISAKTALGWELPENRELIWGIETAYSFFQLTNAEMDLSGNPNSKSGGIGAQTNLSLMNLFPKHHIGFAAASLQPMLLSSADYWNDGWMWEIRHQWFPTRQLSFETRVRVRGDNTRRINAFQKRSEVFPYLRFTYRIR